MKKLLALVMLLATVLALSGCVAVTVDQMYALPKRSTKFNDLQTAIDGAMVGKTHIHSRNTCITNIHTSYCSIVPHSNICKIINCRT